MKNNKVVTIEDLSDMKLFPIHDLNKKNKDNFCIYGKSGKGKKVDIRKRKEIFGAEN